MHNDSLKTDHVNHPAHYTQKAHGIECIEITRTMSFSAGNAFKYVWRHNDKGNPIKDLNKAIWYLNDSIVNGAFIMRSKYLDDLMYEISNNDDCGDILYNIYVGNFYNAIAMIKVLIEYYGGKECSKEQ